MPTVAGLEEAGANEIARTGGLTLEDGVSWFLDCAAISRAPIPGCLGGSGSEPRVPPVLWRLLLIATTSIWNLQEYAFQSRPGGYEIVGQNKPSLLWGATESSRPQRLLSNKLYCCVRFEYLGIDVLLASRGLPFARSSTQRAWMADCLAAL